MHQLGKSKDLMHPLEHRELKIRKRAVVPPLKTTLIPFAEKEERAVVETKPLSLPPKSTLKTYSQSFSGHFSISEERLLPAIRYDYSYIFNSYQKIDGYLKYCLDANPLFKTALSCCREISKYHYSTDLYPVFMILEDYIAVYGLEFLNLVFDK